MNTRILVVEDQALIREGLMRTIKSEKPEWEISGAPDGIEAIRKARQSQPDIILMDYLMPRLDGVRAAFTIYEQFPEIKIIMVTGEMTEEMVSMTIGTGVKGFLSKCATTSELMTAIEKILGGRHHLSDRTLDIAAETSAKRRKGRSVLQRIFSRREIEVLKLMTLGLTSKEIAGKLFISKRTVDRHRSSLLARSGSRTPAELIRFAMRIEG